MTDYKERLDKDMHRGDYHRGPRPAFIMAHPWCVYFGDDFGGRFASLICAARTAVRGTDRQQGVVINDQTNQEVSFADCFRMVSEHNRTMAVEDADRHKKRKY